MEDAVWLPENDLLITSREELNDRIAVEVKVDLGRLPHPVDSLEGAPGRQKEVARGIGVQQEIPVVRALQERRTPSEQPPVRPWEPLPAELGHLIPPALQACAMAMNDPLGFVKPIAELRRASALIDGRGIDRN